MDGKNTEKRSTSKRFFCVCAPHYTCLIEGGTLKTQHYPVKFKHLPPTEVNLLLEQSPKEIIQKRKGIWCETTETLEMTDIPGTRQLAQQKSRGQTGIHSFKEIKSYGFK